MLVTGGAGFIGSNIVGTLLDVGANVTVIDNFLTGKKENLAEYSSLKLIKADIRSFDDLKIYLEDVDYIFHQAALPNVSKSIKNPRLTTDINVLGTVTLLQAALDHDIKALVFASSSSVYGDTPTLPKVETMPTKPLSPYGISKLAAEEYCRVFHEIYGLPTVSLRYFNVFGPKQDPTSRYSAVICSFISKVLKGESPIIYGDGEQSRDFTYVSDVIDANILAAKSKNTKGKVYNIACNQKTTVNELADIIISFSDKNIKPKHDKPREGDIRHSLADISQAKADFNYDPKYSLRDGLQKTYDYFKSVALS